MSDISCVAFQRRHFSLQWLIRNDSWNLTAVIRQMKYNCDPAIEIRYFKSDHWTRLRRKFTCSSKATPCARGRCRRCSHRPDTWSREPEQARRVQPRSPPKSKFFIWCALLWRVTRLGEFSPYGRAFTLGRFIKITKVTQNYGLFFSWVQITYVSICKKWVGLHFGRFLHKLIWSPWSYTWEVFHLIYVFESKKQLIICATTGYLHANPIMQYLPIWAQHEHSSYLTQDITYAVRHNFSSQIHFLNLEMFLVEALRQNTHRN
jgi:hypothetical protein